MKRFLFLLSFLLVGVVNGQDTTVITIYDAVWFDSNNYDYLKATCEKSGREMSYTGSVHFSKNLPLERGVVKLVSNDSSQVRVIANFSNHQLNGPFYSFFPSFDLCKEIQFEDEYENGEVKYMKMFDQYGTLSSRSNFAFTKYRKAPMSKVIAHPDSVYTLRLGQRLHMAPSDFRFSTEQYDSILVQLSEYSNLIALTLNHDRAGDCKLTLEQANEVFGKLSVFQNLEWLDAYHIDCNRFPPEILKLTKLKYLKLGRLTTSTIPQEISNLKELRYLELLGPEIFLPYNLRNLKQLQELKLSTTQESVYLTSNGVPLIPYATTLRIHSGYTHPAKIYGIPKLTQLEVLQIDKGTVVGDLSTLVNLKSFDYRDAVATSLPEGLHNCKNLEKLAIMGKNIRGIDPRIFELPNLKVVKIWYDVISREELKALQEKYPDIIIYN